MSIDLKDLATSPYIVSADYPVGHVFPLATISAIKIEEVPVPNSNKKNKKGIVY